MLLILWITCWLAAAVALIAEVMRPRHRHEPRQTRYLNYFLNDYQVPGSYALRMAADAIQLAGYLGAVSSSLRRLTIARKA